MKNYYKVLEVRDFAENEVITAAYRALSKKYHPDVNSNADLSIMVSINEAYEILSNREKKAKFDEELRLWQKNNNGKNDKMKKARDEKEGESQEQNYKAKKNDFSKGRKAVSEIFQSGALIARTLLGIVIGIIMGLICSFLLFWFLDTNGSWSYILYPIYGSILGSITASISGYKSVFLGLLTAIIALVCMVVPYYVSSITGMMYFYDNDDTLTIIALATKETLNFFLKEGFLRGLFTVFTPIAAASAAMDNYN